MINRHRIVIGVVSALAICGLAIVAVNASGGMSGFFFKAYDKTLAPGERYEKNITVRKYYNLTIRFQKEGTTSSYLTFSDNETTVILKDSTGNERLRVVGIKSGKAYSTVDKELIDALSSIDAINVSEYSDVTMQPVNSTYLTFSGTTAYLTVKVRYSSALMYGYVTDELTGESIHGAYIAAFSDGANVTQSDPLSVNLSDASGFYTLSFDLTADKALDVYVEGYDVS
jgi:hypothetical protein